MAEDDPFDLDRLLDGPTAPLPPVRVVPANEASWEDLKAILGGAGYHGGCWCQRMKLRGDEWWRQGVPGAERARRLEAQTRCGDPGAEETTGLVAYWDEQPVGWCNVEPRSHFIRMGQAPWKGRSEDPQEPGIWCVACTIVKAGFRHKGVSRALAVAAVAFARSRGAKALEGYGMITQPGVDITWGELHVGAVSAFAAAGMREVNRPSKRRVVMRIDF